MNKNVFLLLLCLLLLPFFSYANTTSKGPNRVLTVTPKEDGLHITKKHDPKFVNVTIHVIGKNGENLSITTNEINNSFVYPFVTSGQDYSVYLTMMDVNWGNWTATKAVYVKAEGGIGDYRLSYSAAEYNNNKAGIQLKDYKIIKPELSEIIENGISGTIFYDCTNGPSYNKGVWGCYPEKNGFIDLSSKLGSYSNTNFFVQLNYTITYNNILFSSEINTKEKLFTDIHEISGITVSNGILYPAFNPVNMEYKLKGTDKTVEVTIHTINGENQVFTIKPDSEPIHFQNYSIAYEKPEYFSFDNLQYIETFYDDFEGNELDPTKWKRSNEEERQPTMPNHGWWNNKCSYLNGKGNLILEAKKEGNMLYSGSIETSGIFEQSHGYYEIKFKCENTSGLWYAFWLLGKNDRMHIGNGATDAAEIDIFELIPKEKNNGNNYFKTTIHWDGYGTEHKAADSGKYNLTNEFYNNWHIVQFVWGKTDYKLYLDGTLMWTINGKKAGGMCEGANWMIISSEFGNWGGPLVEKLLPAKMYVDYVKAGLCVE